MWTLVKQAKLQSFCKKPSYILLYIVVCKICSVCCLSSRYNFIAKSYPMLDVLPMQRLPDFLMPPGLPAPSNHSAYACPTEPPSIYTSDDSELYPSVLRHHNWCKTVRSRRTLCRNHGATLQLVI